MFSPFIVLNFVIVSPPPLLSLLIIIVRPHVKKSSTFFYFLMISWVLHSSMLIFRFFAKKFIYRYYMTFYYYFKRFSHIWEYFVRQFHAKNSTDIIIKICYNIKLSFFSFHFLSNSVKPQNITLSSDLSIYTACVFILNFGVFPRYGNFYFDNFLARLFVSYYDIIIVYDYF